MSAFVRPLPFGATCLSGGRARFRLWAPAQHNVTVAIDGRPPIAMTKGDGGWFEVEADAPPGTSYRYRLEDGTSIPDPASLPASPCWPSSSLPTTQRR